MSKARLMQIATLAAAVSLAACGSGGADDSNTVDTAENTATETVEVVEPVVEEAADDMVEMVEEPAVDWAQQERDFLAENATVYFDFDQSTIRSDARRNLSAHVGYLLANTGAKVMLEGHADERGTREYNVALGERRAQAVESYMKLKGVKTEQIETSSFGEERPVSTDHALNRRVEVRYLAW